MRSPARFSLAVSALVASAPAGCAPAPPAARVAEDLAFEEVASAAGLDFVHFDGRTGAYLLAEITCGGGALFDFDGDGDLDLYLAQGAVLGPGKTLADTLAPPPRDLDLADRLYRNDSRRPAEGGGGLRFTDVTVGLGVETSAYGCAVAAGDYDGDGRTDLFLGNLGRNQLLRNAGGGRFEDVTDAAGVGDGGATTAALFFDFDRDGRLDLFAGNYVRFDDGGATSCRDLTGAPDYCGPTAYPFEADRLYHNLGGGRFAEVSVAAGLAAAPNLPALGAVVADFDGDGWPDLYVANDGQPNHLWRNRGDGTFVDVALAAGAAVDGQGVAEASMGVDVGDYDGDNDLDLFLAHLARETNTLYANDGAGGFSDLTGAAGLAAPSLPFTGFGTAFLDYDLDGWLDLVVANGAVTRLPEQAAAGVAQPLAQRNQLFHNRGETQGRVAYDEVTAAAGPAFELLEVSRGLAVGDLDDDGDEDVVVINNGGPVRLLENRLSDNHHPGPPWAGVRLVTGEPARDAFGATAWLQRGTARPLLRQVRTGGSYASTSDPRLLFALAGPSASGLLVAWPDGRRELFPPPPAGRYTTLAQGSGQPAGVGS